MINIDINNEKIEVKGDTQLIGIEVGAIVKSLIDHVPEALREGTRLYLLCSVLDALYIGDNLAGSDVANSIYNVADLIDAQLKGLFKEGDK